MWASISRFLGTPLTRPLYRLAPPQTVPTPASLRLCLNAALKCAAVVGIVEQFIPLATFVPERRMLLYKLAVYAEQDAHKKHKLALAAKAQRTLGLSMCPTHRSEAIKWLRYAVANGDREARKHLGKLYYESKSRRLNAAAKHLFETAPKDDEECGYFLARIAVDRGDYTTAVQLLRRANFQHRPSLFLAVQLYTDPKYGVQSVDVQTLKGICAFMLREQYRPQALVKGLAQLGVCTLCFCIEDSAKPTTTARCGHRFHYDCLLTFLMVRYRFVCPTCGHVLHERVPNLLLPPPPPAVGEP